MGKKVLILSASLRAGSNSEALAQEVQRGAEAAGHQVTFISLKDKTLHFCKGCLACQKTQRCVLQDDAAAIAEAVKEAEAVVFATPIYYYELSGQLKTLLDRLNPLYTTDYAFREIYLVTVAAEDAPQVPERAINGLTGWIDCFEKATLTATLFCGGLNAPGETKTSQDALEKAYNFGRGM